MTGEVQTSNSYSSSHLIWWGDNMGCLCLLSDRNLINKSDLAQDFRQFLKELSQKNEGQCSTSSWFVTSKCRKRSGETESPISNEWEIFPNDTSREMPLKLPFTSEIKQLKWLPWYNIPQSISFTANHFSLSRCCFYWPFIGSSSLLLFPCVLHIYLLFSFPAAKQRHNWIAPNRQPDKSISNSEFLRKFHSVAHIFVFCKKRATARAVFMALS